MPRMTHDAAVKWARAQQANGVNVECMGDYSRSQVALKAAKRGDTICQDLDGRWLVLRATPHKPGTKWAKPRTERTET